MSGGQFAASSVWVNVRKAYGLLAPGGRRAAAEILRLRRGRRRHDRPDEIAKRHRRQVLVLLVAPPLDDLPRLMCSGNWTAAT